MVRQDRMAVVAGVLRVQKLTRLSAGNITQKKKEEKSILNMDTKVIAG